MARNSRHRGNVAYAASAITPAPAAAGVVGQLASAPQSAGQVCSTQWNREQVCGGRGGGTSNGEVRERGRRGGGRVVLNAGAR